MECDAALEKRAKSQRQVEEKLSRSEASFTELRSLFNAAKVDLQQLEEKFSLRDIELVKTNNLVASLQHDLHQMASLKFQLSGELAAITAELDTAAGKHHAMQLNLVTVSDEKAELANNLTQAKSIIGNLERDCDLLRVENAKLADGKAALEGDLTEVFERTRQINYEKVFLRSQLDLAKKANEELEERVDNAERQYANVMSK